MSDVKVNVTSQQTVKKLMQDIAAIRISKTAETVQLVPQLNINFDGEAYEMTLGFKIGLDKLYVVKDVYELLNVIGTNEKIEYGKSFTFDDSRHVFDSVMSNIINILTVSMRKYPPKTSMQKEFVLKGAVRLGILRALSGTKTDITVNSRHYPEMQIYDDNMPIEIQLLKEDENYKLDFEDIAGVTPVSDDCAVCIWQKDIYVTSLEQAGCVKALLEAYKTEKTTSIIFPEEEKTKVVLQLLPKLRAAAGLQVDSTVKRDVIIGELIVKMYVDRSENGNIFARAMFCYDNIEFNHFAGEKPPKTGKVLLRDRRRENQFIRAAAALGFMPENGYLYIDNDYKIYEFLCEGAALLREFGEIYYSKTFDIEVRAPKGANVGLRISSGNLLEFDLEIDSISPQELAGALMAVKEKRKYYRLASGSFLDLAAPAVKNIVRLLDNVDISVSNISGGAVEAPLNRAFYLNTVDAEKLNISRDEYFSRFIDKFSEKEPLNFVLPEQFDEVMRPYQKAGFNWLNLLAEYGMGGILADEMGLGKTLQSIAFVMYRYSKNPGPTLIVAPTSLLYNWQAEIQKFAPDAKVCIVSGTPAERKNAANTFESCHFVITSYGLLRRDIELYNKCDFKYCFIDEAQHIKNPNTINAKSVKRIKAGGFFALTGTPLENTLTELWSIFDFIMPGYLYARHKFRKMYETPIVKDEDKQALESLLRHTRPFILRRLKTQVMAELPDKIESYMVSELENEQKELYIAYAARAKSEIEILTENGGIERNRIKILAIITRLRQLCCHPLLFVENYEGSSGKLEMLKEIVEDAVASGHRLLIFSQFTSMLNIISRELNKIGVSYFYLDGNTKSKSRVEMASQFNSGERDAFLISLKAGGTGLNLTGADMVIHYDPWWNPAVENQATDRAHRIGQTKNVQVLKLVAKGTIEEKICNLQKLKQNMIDSVLETGETMLSHMSVEEIKGLFDDSTL